MANIFVLPDDAATIRAFQALVDAAGIPMPAFTIPARAGYVSGTAHVLPGTQGMALVAVNGCFHSQDLTPIGYSPCCNDPSHGDMPQYAQGVNHVDIDVDYILFMLQHDAVAQACDLDVLVIGSYAIA